MRALHIAYLVASPSVVLGGPSGSARHIEYLVKGLCRLGHRVTLCVARRQDGEGEPASSDGEPESNDGAPASNVGGGERARWASHVLSPAATSAGGLYLPSVHRMVEAPSRRLHAAGSGRPARGRPARRVYHGRAEGSGPAGSVRILELPSAPAEGGLSKGFPGRVVQEHRQALTFASSVHQYLRFDPPDLLLERYVFFGVAGASLRRRFRVPWFLEVNAPIGLERSRYGGFRAPVLGYWSERHALSRADRLLAVSTPLAAFLTSRMGVSAQRIHLLPNGVDLERFCPGPRSSELSRRLGLGGGPVIGFAGSLKPWHGLERWLEVVAGVHAALPDVQGLVVGEGPGRAEMAAQVAHRSLGGVIRFAGQVPPAAMPDYLRQMDLLLAPYPPLEPFYFCPLKVLEALAAGVPVVSVARGDLPDTIGPAGATLPPDDLPGLVRTIEHCLKAPQQLRRWSSLARGQVVGRDWQDVGRAIIGLYQSG